MVLQCLPGLKYLNGKPTKPTPNFEIDIDDSEVDNISLDHELENFQQLFNTIQAAFEDEDKSFFDQFSQQFQNLLNSEIEMINEYLDGSVPNFIYGTKILNSKLKVFNFFNDVIIKIDKNNTLIDTLLKITDLKNKAIFDLEEINKKMLVQVGNYQAKKGNKGLNESQNNNNQNIQLLEEKVTILEENSLKQEEAIYKYEEMLNSMKQELDSKIAELNHYKELESTSLNRINKLEEENKMMTEKLFQQTKVIIDSNKPGLESVNTGGVQNPHALLNQSSKNNLQGFVTKQNPSTSVVISPSGAKVLTKKLLIEIIDEIYASKTNFDRTCLENKMPKETMEQHMYTYLNYKYGLKNLIVEWAVSIINAIKTFSTEDSKVLLFGKILKNEIEEEFRFTFEKLKKTIHELLQVSLIFIASIS